MDEILELEIRKKIYQLITKQPGINLSSLAEHNNIRIPLARYHLLYLEKNNVITAKKEEGFQRYYIKGSISIQDKQYFSLFRQKTLLKIVLYLLIQPYARHRDLKNHLNISRSILPVHTLVTGPVIETAYDGESSIFMLPPGI